MTKKFVILRDKNDKPKKFLNKVIYITNNNIKEKYIKHNNKFITQNEYKKLHKKQKKIKGGGSSYIMLFDGTSIQCYKKPDDFDYSSFNLTKDDYIDIEKNDSITFITNMEKNENIIEELEKLKKLEKINDDNNIRVFIWYNNIISLLLEKTFEIIPDSKEFLLSQIENSYPEHFNKDDSSSDDGDKK